MGIVKKLGFFNSAPELKSSAEHRPYSTNTSMTATTIGTITETKTICSKDGENEEDVRTDSIATENPNQAHVETQASYQFSGVKTPTDSASLLSLTDLNSLKNDEDRHGHTFSHILHKLAPKSISPGFHASTEPPKQNDLLISSQQHQHELKLLKEHNANLHKLLTSEINVFGLENYGNTCYMNSIIQCLFVLDCFKEQLMEAHVVKEIHMQKKNYMPLKPRQFTHNSLTNNGQKPKSKSNFIKVINVDSVLNNLGIKIPGDKVIVGRSSDNKTHSNDTRKKNALLKGPVVNADHLSLNYQTLEKDLEKDDSTRLYYALKDLFEIILENDYNTGVVSPYNFFTTLKSTNMLFQGGMHQDSQEFLSFLLNSMNEHLENSQAKKDVITEKNNFIKDCFQGLLINNTKCLKCNTVSKTTEPFFDIQIPVTKKYKNLSAALNTLIESPPKEILKGSNKFFCDNCDELQKAERVVGISKLPKFLILHLKRYEYSEKENKMVKLFNKMEYPLVLKNDSLGKKYELSGIVVHLGLDSSHGHYVSIVKNEKLGWLIYDDETVMAIQEQDVLKFYGSAENMSCAYLLFYKEIDGSSEKTSSASSFNSTTPQSSVIDFQSSYSRRGSILTLKKDNLSAKQKEYDWELKNFIEQDEAFRKNHSNLNKYSLNHNVSDIETPPVTPNASGTKLNFLFSSDPLNKKDELKSDIPVVEAQNEGVKKSKSRFWKKLLD
ncbi:hypothetical protein QEN19_003400 [Hanseniaspora menglaensis]